MQRYDLVSEKQKEIQTFFIFIFTQVHHRRCPPIHFARESRLENTRVRRKQDINICKVRETNNLFFYTSICGNPDINLEKSFLNFRPCFSSRRNLRNTQKKDEELVVKSCPCCLFNNKTSVVFQRQLRQLKTTSLFFSAYF